MLEDVKQVSDSTALPRKWLVFAGGSILPKSLSMDLVEVDPGKNH